MSLGALGALGDTSLEAVQEAAVDNAQGAHAAGAGGLAALGLLTPVVCSKKKKFVSRVVPTIACILISSPRTMPFFSYRYPYQHVSGGVMRTLAGLSGRVATVSTGGLLDVEGPLA